MDRNRIDTATKYQVELNSKYSDYSKQGDNNNGKNTTESILKIVQQQTRFNNKESGD